MPGTLRRASFSDVTPYFNLEEELHTSHQELETAMEELQSTNEELETTNEELQSTNEELETTNEELTARTTELQELMKTIGNERARLLEIVELAPFSVIVLRGPALIVDAVNPGRVQLFGREMMGEPIDRAFRDSRYLPLVESAHRVVHQNQSEALRLTPSDEVDGRHTVTLTLVPTHDGGGEVTGLVIYAELAPQQT